MAGTRRPLGAGIATLIVVDSVLVIVLAFMLGQHGFLAGVGVPGAGSARPTPSASVEVVRFASPTRNISCAIAPDAARCEIAHIMYATPTLEGCAGDVGHEIEVTPDGARWVCRTDAPPDPPTSDIADLPWGKSVSADGYTCTSEHDGVTCVYDAAGHSFSLARRVVSLS
jgi:hypothetical protein